MFRFWRFLLFFVLCLVAALLINLPAWQVVPYLKLPPSLRLVDVQGTVFSGTAQEIMIGRFPLHAIHYRNLPSCIALLRACYRITNDRGSVLIDYGVLSGDTEISETRIEYPVSELLMQVPNVPVNPLGRLELLIDKLSIEQDTATALSGRLVWRDAGYENSGSEINIGDYQVDFAGDQQKIDFKFSDLDASLTVTGKGEVTADGRYDVDIRVVAKTGIDPNVKNVLDLFTTKTDYNQYRVEQKGRLPPNLTHQLFK